ncbi:hypothetical protein TPHA_0D00370 [Tetrapisispora phaffii CBS 4417]|uniref:Exonuclease domain-containing protein n=1 Tax=Tetrapisispora phaffii (strain ATCC 24235 / CBS 4417 / NBRC 1672 / NRRL Y-8282 / UCD 70-5) TaxID=1071381 RepID=G8BS60_TETPH|nr:hypothetical protein TPHA_0D00370 [Tetrapisispora phaffii CBS 4417]CCE62681.1 hypothetical protein TPHA_0D00370 [Tetrapisispora phaffii CBS 4417]
MFRLSRLLRNCRYYNSIGKSNPYLHNKRTGSYRFPKHIYDSKYKMSSTNVVRGPLVWIDCEMTGLDHLNDHIIEICCIITDGDLNIVKDPVTGEDNVYESVVHYGKDVMSKMNEWCIQQHGSSGLTDQVLKSEKTLASVQQEIQDFLVKYIPEQRVGLLAGNSVHVDRLFLLREFPKLVEHLHYRIVDVSSIMEMCKRHNPELQSVVPPKQGAHTAKSDIIESINQLKWYKEHYFKNSTETAEFVETEKQKHANQNENVVTPTNVISSENKKRKLEN